MPGYGNEFDWSFNFRTYDGGGGDDLDSDDSAVDGTAGISEESRLIKDFDLASREESVVYKPNPFSIAKINAASRPPPAASVPFINRTKSKQAAKAPNGSIVDGFKKQAAKARANTSDGPALKLGPVLTKRTSKVAATEDRTKTPPRVAPFRPLAPKKKPFEPPLPTPNHASHEYQHTNTPNVPVAIRLAKTPSRPFVSQKNPPELPLPSHASHKYQRINTPNIAPDAAHTRRQNILPFPASKLPRNPKARARLPFSRDKLPLGADGSYPLTASPFSSPIKPSHAARPRLFNNQTHARLPFMSSPPRPQSRADFSFAADCSYPLTTLPFSSPIKPSHTASLNNTAPSRRPILNSFLNQQTPCLAPAFTCSPTHPTPHALAQIHEGLSLPSLTNSPTYNQAFNTPLRQSEIKAHSINASPAFIAPTELHTGPSPTIRKRRRSPEPHPSNRPRAPPRKADAYAYLIPNPDEEWSTLPSRKKENKPSAPKGPGIKTSGAFRLPNILGAAAPAYRTGMSATSARRVITFLPPPLNKEKVAAAPSSIAEEARTTECEDAFLGPDSSPTLLGTSPSTVKSAALEATQYSPPTSPSPVGDGTLRVGFDLGMAEARYPAVRAAARQVRTSSLAIRWSTGH